MPTKTERKLPARDETWNRYIMAMMNRKTGIFTGRLCMKIQYLIVIYGEISPSQLIDFKQKTKLIH